MNGSVKTYASRMYLILLLAKVNFENATKRLRYSIKNKSHRHMYYELFYMKVIYPHKINLTIKYWLRLVKFHKCGFCINHYRIYVKCKR